jgi:hypothetical protein
MKVDAGTMQLFVKICVEKKGSKAKNEAAAEYFCTESICRFCLHDS